MTYTNAKAELSAYPAAMSVDEVAEALRLCTKTIYRRIAQGEIECIRIGREYRIAKRDVYRYLHANRSSNPKMCSK